MKTTTPTVIHKLVETFERHLEEYHSAKNETELRREFLDKFFTALGWDVANEKGYDEAHKEVVHEFSVEVAGQGKKADYAFRVGTSFDFLVEAKKPSVKIENSQDAAFQIRRYGWSAKLPINILTDFEHFAVYDCRTKPNYSDKASMGRILLVHYKEYVERWDEIAEIFSPEAVRQGSFAKYAEGMKGKKGTADVDDAFLQEIERWRELLAKNIALRNDEIDIPGLNYAVQMTIDRIVFLRICEERGIEPENQLLDIATPPPAALRATSPKFDKNNSDADSKTGVEFGGGREGVVYQELCELFKRADTKYNSGLFHFKKEKELVSRPDDLTLTLDIDDKVLKDIISNLYYPKSPYAFLYIPSDILGQVYERFLGKVIRLTAGHQAKVEEKPEVRKAGGVYYTPTYIVDYIVKNTVGKLVEEKRPEGFGKDSVESRKPSGRSITPADVAKLKIVDPACGSGTFLLGAYQFLLDWHLNWYVNDDVEKWERQKAIWKVESGYRLTTAKKKEILLNNIHGVDIDAQAVEVTKLSLLLKVLENASGQLELGMERILPDLGDNIKCGNSLIGWDYFEGQLFPSEEERARVNPFDWRNEFKDVFSEGGFDVVIGNPPYVRMEEFSSIKTYLRTHYDAHEERADFYTYFIELASLLINNSGVTGMIVSNKFSVAKYGQPLRATLQKNVTIQEITDFAGANVFKGATVRTFILFFARLSSQRNITARYIPVPTRTEFEQIERGGLSVNDYANRSAKSLADGQLTDAPWELISSDASGLLNRLKGTFPTLRQYFDWRPLFGIKTGFNEAFVVDEDTRTRLIEEDKSSADVLRPILFGKDVKPYSIRDEKRYVVYLHPDKDPKNFPAIKRHLEIFRSQLNNRAASQKWYELQQPAISLVPLLAKSKIVYPIIAPEPRFTLDSEGFLINDKLFVLPTDSLFLLGILNSSLANFFFSSICARLEGMGENYYEFRAQFVERFPVCPINFSDLAEKAQHDKMVSLVEQMLASHKSLAVAQSPQEKERLERQIKSTDRAIDSLVYELYGLSEEEIKIVEG